jgi:sodium/hydrogen antiporter
LGNETVLAITELTLALLLFADASTIQLRDVEGDAGLPRRLLFVGLPLTIVAGALLAYLMFPHVGWAAAALVATILAPPTRRSAWRSSPTGPCRRGSGGR